MSAQSNDPQLPPASETTSPLSVDRRSFLAGAGGIAAIGASGAILPALTGTMTSSALASTPALGTDEERRSGAFRVRLGCATQQYNAGLVQHPVNGDEQLYPDRIGNFSKGLPHNNFGEVAPAAYTALLAAVAARTQISFESIPSGCPNSAQRLKLTNPLGGVAYDLQGVDGCNTFVRAAPALASAEEAGEIVENYWMALLRDVPFSEYATNPLAAQACADLSALSDF